MMRNKTKPRAMSCLWCHSDKEAKILSAFGREDGNGYMVSFKYIACENKGCRDHLIGEAAGGPIKILRLDLSIVDREFRDPIDREKIKKFIRKVLN
ncbi:MAG TPA: hypothetical protein VF390_02680, partial [Patescibacteria group bacterium]